MAATKKSKEEIFWNMVQNILEVHGDEVGKITIYSIPLFEGDDDEMFRIYYSDNYCFETSRCFSEEKNEYEYCFFEEYAEYKTAGIDKAIRLLKKYTD